MKDVVIVTGAFSSGETVVRKTIGESLSQGGLSIVFLSDGHYLAQEVKKGIEDVHYVRPEKGNLGFCIIDQGPIERMYDNLVADVPESQEGRLVLIESARCKGVRFPELDMSYASLRGKIPFNIWQRSIVIYTSAPQAQRFLWNLDRKENPRDELEGTSFYVPAQAMDYFARSSDFKGPFQAWLERMGVPVYVIENRDIDFEELQKRARDVATQILRDHLAPYTKEG